MSYSRRSRCLLFAALGVLATLLAQPSSAQDTAKIPIRIAWQPDPNAPLYIAREKKMFEAEGLQPEYIKFLAAPAMFAALQSESVDVADMGLAPAIIGRSQGIDLKMVMIALDVSATNVLVANKGQAIGSAKDLKGKKIGAQRGTTPYFGLTRYLEQAGMGIQDVQFIDLTAPNIVPAFRRGEVDAAWVWSPWQNMLVGAGGKPVVSNKDVGAFGPQVWAARTAWMQKNPEALQRFMKVIDKAFQQIGTDQDLAAQQLADTLNVDRSVALDILKANDHPELKIQASAGYALSPVAGYPDGNAGLSAATRQTVEFLHGQGIIKAPVAAADVIDPEPLKRYVGAK